ncbi:MAG: chromosome segregation protein SMC [Desulfobacterales bacterium]|nr:chromosome segregation protein SMC [Desulfobacterales bacterium]
MRLKRLEISGFKSFPEKSVIDFPPGISAVVGPNGCGKSNIFDAIKWVMGEQSIKQLRGKSMGDVIFAGTDRRPPTNLAEVCLILTNDGTNGPDAIRPYSEIMITRRLYRSGESVYLLNKQPCRLKDIHNIFLGTGMGSKSCAIVQQGNIGAITEASPEERRSFIEEAAGVMRYKTRKKEALQKVETTRRNLDRLNDLINEIEQQLAGLYQAASTARHYKELQGRLKAADIQVAVHYYLVYAEQIEKTEAELDRLSQKDADDADALEELNARLEALQSETEEKNRAISRQKSEANEKQRRMDKLSSELEYRQQEKDRLAQEIADLRSSYDRLVEKNEKLDAEISEEVENEERLNADIKAIQKTIEQENAKTKDIRGQLKSANEKLEEKQNRVMELSAYKAKYQNIYQNAQANKDDLKKRLKRLISDETEASKRVEELSGTESETKERFESLGRQRDGLRTQIDEAKKRLSEKNEALGKQVKTVNTLTNERSKLRSRYAALKKMEDNYEWYRDGVKAIMKDPKSVIGQTAEKGAAIRGTIADAVTPDDGYELALEACLGEALQFILVSDRQTGVDSILYLQKNDLGRCGFMPLYPAGGKDESSLGETPGADFLIHHLSIQNGFEGAIQQLVGKMVVAEDFETALQIKEASPHTTIVTKTGEFISSNGVMVGGSTSKLTGIYEKKHEIRELDHRIKEIGARITEEEKVQGELEDGIRKLETRLHEMNTQQKTIDDELNQLEKSLYKTAERLKHARQQHEIICLEKKRLEGEKTDIETEIEAHDTALAAVKRDIAEAEAAVNETRQTIDALSETVKSHDQHEMELKLDMTKLQAELDSSRSTLRRLRKFSEDGASQIENINADIEAKTERQHSAEASSKTLESRIAKERETLEAMNRDLKSEQDHYQSLLKEIKSIESTISDTQQNLTKTQEKKHQLELDLSRYKINQDNVTNRFLEKYAASFTQYVNEYKGMVKDADFSIDRIEAERTELKKEIESLGEVNLGAIAAYEEQKARYDFFVEHRDDLVGALNDLQNVIQRINKITQKLFMDSFSAIDEKFRELFPRLFEGGKAWLVLTQPNNPLETGVELMIHPPGKKLSRLSLLSGGEKALSAIAFIFSIFLINPASYCLLDEIDAPLDEVNIHRFNELLKIIGEKSQIIMVTHNKNSMEFSDMLYGITMGESGVSKIVSVDVERILNEKSSTDNTAQPAKETQ